MKELHQQFCQTVYGMDLSLWLIAVYSCWLFCINSESMAFCAHLRRSPALAALQGLVPQQWRVLFCWFSVMTRRVLSILFTVFHGFLTASRPACWRVSSSSWLRRLAATSKICSVRTSHSSMDCIDWFGVMPSKYFETCSTVPRSLCWFTPWELLVVLWSDTVIPFDPVWSSDPWAASVVLWPQTTRPATASCHATSCHVAPCICNAPARTSAPLWTPWPPLTERDVRN